MPGSTEISPASPPKEEASFRTTDGAHAGGHRAHRGHGAGRRRGRDAARAVREVDGILVVDKPRGPTSHDVVQAVRDLLGVRKVGHTGTLDPMATGVLPLVLGQGTKLARYLTGGDKAYLATIRLGMTTDTLDAEGTVLATQPVEVDADRVRAAVASLAGVHQQVPPMYSAKKINGQKLYRLARQGAVVAREAKEVTIFEVETVTVSLPEVVVRLRCSAGTYVRVLAEQLGESLGCGAHLRALRRTQAGPFGEDAAAPLAALEADPSGVRGRLRPLGEALGGLPRVAVPIGLGRLVTRGHQLSVANLRALDTPAFCVDDPLVIAEDGGRILAVTRALVDRAALEQSRRDAQALRTERVLG